MRPTSERGPDPLEFRLRNVLAKADVGQPAYLVGLHRLSELKEVAFPSHP